MNDPGLFRTGLANRSAFLVPGMHLAVLAAIPASCCGEFTLALVTNQFITDSRNSRQPGALAATTGTDSGFPKIRRAGGANSSISDHQSCTWRRLIAAEAGPGCSDASVADWCLQTDISAHLLSALRAGARFEQAGITLRANCLASVDLLRLYH